jgi:sec-independent protein translocase protein TatB
MFGIDSPELLVIAVVALVVIGPKELPGMLRSWGKWMAKARGMAAEFRGHVDEMVRQSELDEVKKQLEGPSGLDLKSLDPTKEIKSAIQEGMAEGEKAMAEAKTTFDNPLAEPESAPQIAAEPAAEPAPETAPTIAVEPPPEPLPATAEAAPSPPAESSPPAEQEKPAKAVAAG